MNPKHNLLSRRELCYPIIESIQEAVFVHDGNTGEVLDVNQAALKMFRCSNKEQMLGFKANSFSLGHYPYSQKEVQEKVNLALRHGPQLFLWRSKRLDGSLFWSEVSLNAVRTPKAFFIIAVVRDITKRIEQKLELERNRYKSNALFDHIKSGAIICNIPGKSSCNDFIIVDINKAACILKNVQRTDAIGKSICELFPGKEGLRLLNLIEWVITTGLPEHTSLKYFDNNQLIRWEEVRAYKLPTGEIVLLFEDLTSEKLVSTALVKNQNLLKGIVESIPAAICIVNAPSRTFEWISPYIEKISGYKPEELISQTPRILYDTEEEYKRVGTFYKEFKHRDLVELETVFRHKDGSTKNIFLKAVRLEKDKILATILDITERKKTQETRQKMERQLLHIQKLESLEMLAGGIAHDFNNLLLAILGNAELLSLSSQLDSRAKRHLRAIERAGHRAAKLANQMLTYAGKTSLALKPVDIQDIINEKVQMMELALPSHIHIRQEESDKIPSIEGDREQLGHAIMNLLTNASEAIENGEGLINIKTSVTNCSSTYLAATLLGPANLKPGQYVEVEISDNGCGMDDKVLSRIFEPFFSTKFTGRGLGMSAVHGIVKAHKGTLDIKSHINKGTTVRVLFPVLKDKDPN